MNINNNGKRAASEGKNYELKIHQILSKCKNHKDEWFNTQSVNELGTFSADNDIVCNWNSYNDIAIEIKKMKTPDWMQCSLMYDNQEWKPKTSGRIPVESQEVFYNLLKNSGIHLFNGQIPPFLTRKITHQEWIAIKYANNDFKDVYFPCPPDTITKIYQFKKCNYIQVSNKGLYHLGEDICNFGVPLFECPQEIRIRIKVHNKSDKNGFTKLSIMMACKPQNIYKLKESPYNLESIQKLPKLLKYII